MYNKENLLEKEQTLKQNRVWFRIASACNNKCIFCLDSNAHNGTFPDSGKIEERIKKGFKKGYENRAIISGGEASINPKFPQYIKYAKKVGYDRVQTITHGNMFYSEDFCKKVFNAGLEEVTFSFHGHNSKLHDYLVATPGAFKKSLKGLIYVKKNFPGVIVNIDIVVNKINVRYLADIVKFFMKLGIHEYDILQIIPFGRGFSEHKDKLFYNTRENITYLQETWKLSRVKGMYMWTNRFPAESFEGYEDLIQDPRKIKSEVMAESRDMFNNFITSNGEKKPECFGEACSVCFQKQYCHDFIKDSQEQKTLIEGKGGNDEYILEGQEFPSLVYEKFGQDVNEFKSFLQEKLDNGKSIINLPKCLGGISKFQKYTDVQSTRTLEDYTQQYVKNLYRKKSLRCQKCKYNNECEGIHINFIRSYGFKILEPII